MFRKTLAVLGMTLPCLTTVGFADDTATTLEQQEEIDKLLNAMQHHLSASLETPPKP